MGAMTVDFKFIAFWGIWIIGVGVFGGLIIQQRKKKDTSKKKTSQKMKIYLFEVVLPKYY